MSTVRDDGPASGPPEANLHTLLRAVLAKQLLLMVRYRVNFAAQFVSLYLIFAVVFFGGQAAASNVGGAGSLQSTFDGVIVGWFLWSMAQAAYFSLPGDVTSESQWGTLEQLYMSPHGFGTVMAVKVLVNMVTSVLVGAVILVMMLVTTQRSLSVDIVTIAPIVVLGLLSVVGVGFVFAGLALVYKRVESFSNLMQFGLVGLIAAPAADVAALRLLPLVQASAMLQTSMRNGQPLWEYPALNLGLLVATGLTYALAGYAVFRVCAREARKRGVMGHY